jgi:hypothetical protein
MAIRRTTPTARRSVQGEESIRTEYRSRLPPPGSPPPGGTHLLEEAFKTCRADELEDYCLDKEQPALLNDHIVIAYTTADAPSEYEGEFVFVLWE